jgi:hypothetical protein
MGRLIILFLACAVAAASAVALVSCGGGDADLLSGTDASEIESSLDDIERMVDEGDCVGAELAVADVVDSVEELREVDQRLKAALREGTTKLSEVVGRCEEEDEETEPTPETDVEPEEVEDEKKPKKEKSDEDGEEPSESGEERDEGEGPDLPPQSEGKGEEKGGGEPPTEAEPEETAPSGGVGPNVGVE